MIQVMAVVNTPQHLKHHLKMEYMKTVYTYTHIYIYTCIYIYDLLFIKIFVKHKKRKKISEASMVMGLLIACELPPDAEGSQKRVVYAHVMYKVFKTRTW